MLLIRRFRISSSDGGECRAIVHSGYLAAIMQVYATEVKVNNALREETGKDKKDIGREAFLGRAWKWKEEYGGRITKQCRKLGDSCDWRRERLRWTRAVTRRLQSSS